MLTVSLCDLLLFNFWLFQLFARLRDSSRQLKRQLIHSPPDEDTDAVINSYNVSVRYIYIMFYMKSVFPTSCALN